MGNQLRLRRNRSLWGNHSNEVLSQHCVGSDLRPVKTTCQRHTAAIRIFMHHTDKDKDQEQQEQTSLEPAKPLRRMVGATLAVALALALPFALTLPIPSAP